MPRVMSSHFHPATASRYGTQINGGMYYNTLQHTNRPLIMLSQCANQYCLRTPANEIYRKIPQSASMVRTSFQTAKCLNKGNSRQDRNLHYLLTPTIQACSMSPSECIDKVLPRSDETRNPSECIDKVLSWSDETRQFNQAIMIEDDSGLETLDSAGVFKGYGPHIMCLSLQNIFIRLTAYEGVTGASNQ